MQNVLFIILLHLMGTSQLHAESAALIEAQIEGKNRLTDTGMYRVYTHPPSRIDMNRYQTWGIYIEDAAGNALDGVSLKVNADMPAHGHGLLSNPQIKPGSAPGRYRVEGLRFHMPGYWEIRLQMRYLGKQDGLVLPVELE